MQFSKQELEDLAVSAVVIGFSFAWIMRGALGNFLLEFLVMLISVSAAFILHEIAHKFAAQRYGCWAEYRKWDTGLIIAFLLAVSPLRMVFAAPGAVVISSVYGLPKRENGIVSAAGPATNLILALLFMFIAQSKGFLGILGQFGAAINAWIALFNLIPFPPLDGSKVMGWSIQVWGLMVVVALFLLTL